MVSATPKSHDVIVVGAGPVGLFSVFACGMMGLSCHVIDSLDQVGGQCSALYPEKKIYDIPAFPDILAKDLVSNLHAQAQRFQPTYTFHRKVTSFDHTEGLWHLTTDHGETLTAPFVILAAGAGLFKPKRPPLPGLEAHEGTQVFYHVDNMQKFRDMDIVIAGGGDSALDWTLNLMPLAKSVTLIHRRAEFRGHPETQALLHAAVDQKKVILKAPYQLHALKTENNTLTHVEIKHKDTSCQDIPCDALLLFFGLAHDLGPLLGWGLKVDHKGVCVDFSTCLSSQPHMYAVGDVARYPYKRPLIMTGFAEAAQAAQHIYHTKHPDKALHFSHSSDGVPCPL